MKKYNSSPEVIIKDYTDIWQGYDSIAKALKDKVDSINKDQIVLAIECYPGVSNDELNEYLISRLNPQKAIFADDFALDGNQITEMVYRNLTDDRVFGVFSHHQLKEFFPLDRIKDAAKDMENTKGLIVVYGTGAAIVAKPDILVYADLARWEIQLRYRKGMSNWKVDNNDEDILRKYKRGYFFEWRVADRFKNRLFKEIDFLLDTNVDKDPKMISGEDYRNGLSQVVKQPFRVVPYFDESVWGGQWMKENYDLDRDKDNYGWAFDGIPEENSLYLRFGDVRIEVPSINLVHNFPDELLGLKVHSRFGKEFPIRFDYLDTMEGGNLSLQVHPLVEYIQDKFGMHYTQDESYYILDAKDGASVYLGVKEGVTLDEMMNDLEKAQEGEYSFPDEKYINKFEAKKHDHFLIPAGTIHCGGSNTVILEISATPYIFTFKLWDWDRLGLDGKPRPVHLDHGRENIQMSRTTRWVRDNLINQFKTINNADGNISEKTGLADSCFIETHRHWVTTKITLETHDSVNMLNLVEGESAIVESVDGSFDPYIVNYGETFIIPEQLHKYSIRPASGDGKIAVIQAFVRNL